MATGKNKSVEEIDLVNAALDDSMTTAYKDIDDKRKELGGKISFREMAPMAPKSFEKYERFIELEYRPIYIEERGKSKKLFMLILPQKIY